MTFELRQPSSPNNLRSIYLPTYLHLRRRRPHRHAYRMATPPQSGS